MVSGFSLLPEAPQPAAAFAARRRGAQRRHGALGHGGALAPGTAAGDDQVRAGKPGAI